MTAQPRKPKPPAQDDGPPAAPASAYAMARRLVNTSAPGDRALVLAILSVTEEVFALREALTRSGYLAPPT